MRGVFVAILAALALALACGGSPVSSPTAPSPAPAPAPSPAPAPTPAPTPAPPASRFTVVLPVAAGDTGTTFFGMTAFGIHFGGTGPSGHGLDGHPGWDVEFRIGASVRAAADGIVQSVFTDSFINSRSVIQIQHTGGGNYRTVYTNVESVAAGITANAPVTRGQALGTAGVIAPTTGRRASYAMTHFQVDDFSRNEGSTNPNSVNPETFLDPAGRALFDAVWATAGYDVELTEPLTGNTRDVTFPITRTWTRESGSLAARIELVRRDASSNVHTYVMYDAGGAVTERGSISGFEPTAGSQTSIDFVPQSGPSRQGLIDIVGGTMRLDLPAAGAARPRDLSSASAYRTQVP